MFLCLCVVVAFVSLYSLGGGLDACVCVCWWFIVCVGLCVMGCVFGRFRGLGDHDGQLVSGRVFQSCGGDGACMLCALWLRVCVCVILCLIVCWWSDVCVVGIHVCDCGMCW